MNTNKKTYLCKEHNEEFTVQASNLQEAEYFASIYGGVVIKELRVLE